MILLVPAWSQLLKKSKPPHPLKIIQNISEYWKTLSVPPMAHDHPCQSCSVHKQAGQSGRPDKQAAVPSPQPTSRTSAFVQVEWSSVIVSFLMFLKLYEIVLITFNQDLNRRHQVPSRSISLYDIRSNMGWWFPAIFEEYWSQIGIHRPKQGWTLKL